MTPIALVLKVQRRLSVPFQTETKKARRLKCQRNNEFGCSVLEYKTPIAYSTYLCNLSPMFRARFHLQLVEKLQKQIFQIRYLESVASVCVFPGKFCLVWFIQYHFRILRQRQEWYPIYLGQQTLAMRQFSLLLHFPAHFWLSEVSELEES